MLILLLWSLPAVLVVAAIASGRCNTTMAALLGLLAALPITVLTGPAALDGSGLSLALLRGLWIGATIAPYILGGLLFWQTAMPATDAAAVPATGASSIGASSIGASSVGAAPANGDRVRRRQLFFACFLIGPFAESATGFGVGMLGTVALLRGLALSPRYLMMFALVSQTLIPWGGMGSGTMLAAAYARMPAAELGLYCIIPVSLLMAAWLPLFWRLAARAGLAASAAERLGEAGWIITGLTLLALATAALGPETALLAAWGPLIVARYLIDKRPDRQALLATARRMTPYVLLIGCLVATRLQPEWRAALTQFGRIAPFPDLPSWSPLFHAGSWLLLGALLLALRGGAGRLVIEAQSAWRTGRQAVLTVFLFAMMAETLAAGGISQAVAERLFAAWQAGALLVTPLLAGGFGILANSGNAPNSLLMPAQLAMAQQAGVSLAAAAALLHVAGTSMSLFSPVRMSIAAQLARGRGEERAAYGLMLPFALAGAIILFGLALMLIKV